MIPIGPLMREHRLIEQMVGLVKQELGRLSQGSQADAAFIDTATDFFRTYADRTHHGKEEDILFRDLANKGLSPEHLRTMQELVDEHVLARKTVGRLVAAKEDYVKGNVDSLGEILDSMRELITLYPAHIEKEDKHFFYPCMEYFSKPEQDGMLQEFWDFDQKMIHEKYQKVVDELRGG
ncbi:MAG TPA: cation-binding protein [Dehalococcoidia bacterium]|nr:cation-binding protein [Dehalococcoidia bacterium]